MPGEGGGPGPEIVTAAVKTAVESAIPKVTPPVPELGAFNPVEIAQSIPQTAPTEVATNTTVRPNNIAEFPAPPIETTPPVDQNPRPANVVEFPPQAAPLVEPEQQDPAYQALIDQAEKTTADNITARQMAGEVIPPDKQQEIHENDLEMAAYAFASQHPDQAKILAEKDPRLKTAFEKIEAQKQNKTTEPASPDYQSANSNAQTIINTRIIAKEQLSQEQIDDIKNNELDHAASEFAEKYPEKARQQAETDPRIKAALEKIAQQKAEEEQSEANDLREQLAALQEEFNKFREATIDINNKLIEAITTQKPQRKALLIEMILEMLKVMALSSGISVTKGVVDQAKAA